MLSALGSVLLAVSVFLPWYGVSLTANGLGLAQQAGDRVVTQYGNAALQSAWSDLQVRFSGLAGHELGTASAHQALHKISVVLLVLAGIAVLVALRPLADAGAGLPEVGRGWIAAIGAVAAGLVLYRVVQPPVPDGDFVSISVHWGAWLALISAAAMVVGGLWQPGPERPADASTGASEDELNRAWSGLSGWTPPS